MSDLEKPQLNWPKEILEYLRRAGPIWSSVLGIALLEAGEHFNLSSLIGSGIGVLAVGFLLFVSRRPSRLLRKDAFMAVRGVYVGRDRESDQLSEAIRRTPLLWVTGESGSGKSSLLRLGVVPRLQKSGEFLPLYIDDWGSDWEAGPIAAVAYALRESVVALGARLEFAGKPSASDLTIYLKQASLVLNRTPILMLDQFDDYLVDNVDRFCPGGAGLIISSANLIDQNNFWRELASLLQTGMVRCMLVVRQEQGWGQSAVTFLPIREFSVPRLQQQFLDQILRQLSEGAIENPESGWQNLRERLQKDLYKDGGILPIQMRVVLRQLSSLDSLTVKAYEKAGGVLGLSAGYAAEVVDKIAKFISTDPIAVRRVLHELVNPADHSKTRDVSLDVLANRLTDIIDLPVLIRMLEQLKAEEMVRDHPDESGNLRWRLDHDFLALAVEELDRRENSAQRLLDEHLEILRSANSWNKRKAIITPQGLARVFWGLTRGNLTFARAWPIVAASAALWSILLFVGILVLTGVLKETFDIPAQRYVAVLEQVPGDEQEWAKLATEPLPVRQHVEQLFLSDNKRTSLLVADGKRARMAAAAFGGLSPSAQSQFRMQLDCSHGELTSACIFLASQFGLDAETVGQKMLAAEFDHISAKVKHLRREDPDASLAYDEELLADVARFAPEKLNKACHSRVQHSREPVIQYLHCSDLLLYHPEPPAIIPVNKSAEDLKDNANLAIEIIKKQVDSPANLDAELRQSLLPADPQVLEGLLAAGSSVQPALKYVPLLLKGVQEVHSVPDANILAWLAFGMPANQVSNLGKNLLSSTRSQGVCFYRAQFVRTIDDIPTALAAVESPACALSRNPNGTPEAENIQNAIIEIDATTHDATASNVDRWTFARKWVRPNAARYHYDPDRFNTFYYSYIYPLFEPFRWLFRTSKVGA